MTENEVREHNRYYAGASAQRKKHGQGKPGTSRQDNISSRFSRIRYDEKDFVVYGYIDIPYIHKARLEALEHDIKAILVEKGFKHTGNDHFEYELDKRFSVEMNNKIFCIYCLLLAIKYCREHNLKYKLTWLGSAK